MFLKFILVFCVIPKEYGVIQNVASAPYKHYKEIQVYNRVNLDGYRENPKKILKNHFNVERPDFSIESRRLFDWIKKILHKNETNVTPKIPSHEEVLDERARYRLIEKNLTETLTKLSRVLTQILNIVKYAKYQYFNDIHQFLPTNIGNNTVPNSSIGRYKRGLDLNITPADIRTETKPNNKNHNSQDTEAEIHIKMDNNKINKINHELNVSFYENTTKIHSNVSTKNENDRENIIKMDLNKSINTVFVKKENNEDLKGLENIISKNKDTKVTCKVLRADVLTQSNTNDFNKTETPVNGSSIVTKNTVNINSHKNITKRDVSQTGNSLIKLESIGVNFKDKSRIKRDTKEINKEVVNSTETTEIMANSEFKQENSSAKAEDLENGLPIKADFITKSGRRILIQTKPSKVHDEIKNRLFIYIDEAFNEIMKKIDSLKQTKDIFSKDVSYRVGYIISNIDTLEVNMRNMRMEMNRNKYIWDDKKILNLYDTVKVSNQAVSDLLEILKSYVERSLN